MERTFEQNLDEAITLLRRRGRLTLGAIRRHLGIDEAYAADLKEELVRGQRVATEHDGVLVWSGDRVSERRQLTVMFCDLVGSVSLSEQLDPEELRDLVRTYQAQCEEPIRRHEGRVAQYLGDGVLSYFGFPVAHEDDARRAVRAALAILGGMREVSENLERERGLRFAVRIAVHTGLVVVDEVGFGDRRDELAFGEAPNVAARIQALAEPGTILISGATHHLVAADFDVEALGPQSLRGLDEQVHVYRVQGERLIRAPRARSTPLVGRGSELGVLLGAWSEARAGRGRNVIVSGEPGIGKSRLVQAARERTEAPGVRRIVFECSPYFANSALYPVAQLLEGELAFEADESDEQKRATLERFVRALGFAPAETMPYLSALLRIAVGDGYASLDAMATKMAAHRLLVEYLLRVASGGPAVIVWEDLQWADPSTIELLGLFFERSREAAILTIGTTRPEGEGPWRGREDVSLLAIQRLTRGEVEALVMEVTGGKEIPPEVLRDLTAKTDGVPLFVEETMKAVLESDLLNEEGGRYVLRAGMPALGIPLTLKDSLMARLDRLPGVKRVAQLAAAIGRHFSSDLLASIAGVDPSELGRALDRLVGAGLVVPPPGPDGAYAFKHALLRDIAYESMLHASKRSIHERIAEALETEFTAMGASQPELLAYHLAQAGFVERAIHQYADAGRRAATRSDNAEAVAHMSAGVALAASLPEGRARDELELALQIRRAGALRATKGMSHPSTGEAYERARTLCHRLLDDTQLVPTLNGLYSFHLVRAEYAKAGETARELLALAERQRNDTHEMIGHRAVGAVLLHLGKLHEAREHLEEALTLYDPQVHGALAYTHGTDHSVITSSFLSLALWALGEPAKAHAMQEQAIATSERMAHVHSLAQALVFRCLLLTLEGDAARAAPFAERLLELSTRHWLGLMAATARFWIATAKAPRTRATVDEMRRALDGWWGHSAFGYRPLAEVRVAEALMDIGDAEGALEWVARAERHTVESEERWTEPEVLRVKARVLGAIGRVADGRASVERARAVAEAQGARGWDAKLGIAVG